MWFREEDTFTQVQHLTTMRLRRPPKVVRFILRCLSGWNPEIQNTQNNRRKQDPSDTIFSIQIIRAKSKVSAQLKNAKKAVKSYLLGSAVQILLVKLPLHWICRSGVAVTFLGFCPRVFVLAWFWERGVWGFVPGSMGSMCCRGNKVNRFSPPLLKLQTTNKWFKTSFNLNFPLGLNF